MIVPRSEILNYLLLNEKEENLKGKGGEIPIKFRDFEDIFNFI